jgi:hypothetical protein
LSGPKPYFFVTVDAETELIRDGIRAISALREDVEARAKARIPIVWLVRFQRGWTEYTQADSAELLGERPEIGFDGFALAREELLELRARGDEIGWHYHAYHYLERGDLSHAVRLKILEADLLSCGRELRRRHPGLPVASFRFGWFFVPDYAIYATLRRVGISRDASIRPSYAGRSVAGSEIRYLPPLTEVPAMIDGLALFPFSQTVLVHDWSLVPHDLGWSRLAQHGAEAQRAELSGQLEAIASRVEREHGSVVTYETFPSSLLATGRQA